MNTLEDIAKELSEMWINGNRSDVIKMITNQGTRARAALLAVLVYDCLAGMPEEQAAFRRMLGGWLR